MIRVVTATRTASTILSFSSLALVLTSCTEPKKTTGLGAAAGGALGAGLGAIIGNQTGNAGAGLAIGALAGTATGSLVGNALQAQQESIRSQDEAIERQERVIQAQRNEIAELRSRNSDTTVEQKRTLLQRRGPNPLDKSRLGSSTPDSLSRESEKATWNTHEARGRLAPESVKLQETTITPRKVESPRMEGTESVKSSSIPVSQPSGTAKLVTTRQETSKVCDEAAAESSRAAAASEEADKLFHLRRALRLCPNKASFHHELGALYASMKRTSDAEHEFKKALSLDPEYEPARESLEQVTRSNEE
jgi:outer membrane lipoprotein SlyB